MNQDLVTKARDCLRIHSIALRESRLTMQETFFANIAQELSLQTKIGVKNVNSGTRFDERTQKSVRFVRGYIEAGVRLIAVSAPAPKEGESVKDEASNIAAELLATYLAEYDLEEGKDVAPDAANEFLQHNAVYHVWTYWREYVQSTFARAMLPHVTLPMMVFTSQEPAKPDAKE